MDTEKLKINCKTQK